MCGGMGSCGFCMGGGMMGMGMMGGGMGGCMCGGKSTHPFDLLTNTHTPHTLSLPL